MSQESGPVLIGGTTFNCYHAYSNKGSSIIGTFDLQAKVTGIEVSINFNAGDTTPYQLDYWINEGEKETVTITPENNVFTKYGSYSSFKSSLIAPYMGGDGSTNCRIRLF